MIEFRIRYWESGPFRSDVASISCCFGTSGVEIAIVNVATLSDGDWDQRRAQIISRPHSEWAAAYAGTPIGPDLTYGRLPADTMMAIAALHLLTPSSAQARVLEMDPSKLSELLQPRRVKDALKNELLVFGPQNPSLAGELVRFGLLQEFEVAIYAAGEQKGRGSAYFKPFHVPGTASGTLSPKAQELRDKLWASIR